MIGNRKERKLSYCYLKTLSSKDERKNYLYVEYYGNLVGSKFHWTKGREIKRNLDPSAAIALNRNF